MAEGFTKKYGLKQLVYAEWHDDVLSAKQRELNIKHWPRAWKVQLIHRGNPFWEDLYEKSGYFDERKDSPVILPREQLRRWAET